jgi:hypothetical protein
MEIVYIETTIVSYLVARPSRDLLRSARQKFTRQWWNEERKNYHCITSNEVLREASRGDAEMIRLRLDALRDAGVFAVDEKALSLAENILKEKILPPAVLSDAIHASMSAIHGANFLLTWNCRHLANPHLLPQLRAFMARHKLTLPEVCTPLELMAE